MLPSHSDSSSAVNIHSLPGQPLTVIRSYLTPHETNKFRIALGINSQSAAWVNEDLDMLETRLTPDTVEVFLGDGYLVTGSAVARMARNMIEINNTVTQANVCLNGVPKGARKNYASLIDN